MNDPNNEMGVVVNFAQRCEGMGYEIISVQADFPDALIRNKNTGQLYRVEFEYDSASFVAHQHDPRGCDLIVCWIDNLAVDFSFLPVWELREWDTEIYQVEEKSALEKESMYLKLENRRLKREISVLRTRLEEVSPKPATNGNGRIYHCDICESDFDTSPAFAAHVRWHHNVQ